MEIVQWQAHGEQEEEEKKGTELGGKTDKQEKKMTSEWETEGVRESQRQMSPSLAPADW